MAKCEPENPVLTENGNLKCETLVQCIKLNDVKMVRFMVEELKADVSAPVRISEGKTTTPLLTSIAKDADL